MSVKEDVLAVQKVFPNVYCISYNGGYCVAWEQDIEPIIATGRKPTAAWHNAAKLVKGKNKKQLEKLKVALIRKEAERNAKL